MQRRTSRLASLALVAALFVPAAGAQSFTATLVANGLSAPIALDSPPGDTSRIVVARQNGVIRLIKDGTLVATPFLDASALTVGSGERGLLGIAFHPDYTTNGKFYISYTNTGGSSVVRQYLRDGGNPDIIDPASFTTIFGPLSQPFSNHNGGCIRFGADGKLYYGLGDGGSGNDPGNRAQTPSTPLGKMLRFDVDLPFPHVPADNPFINTPGTDPLIWALGVRNPWRFSFDRLTGDMWMGDVGQNAREEINFQPAASAGGENYGWRCMEGFNCTGLSGCVCNSPSLTLPVHQYTTGSNCAVTGGYRYRGSLMPSLVGHYFFADYCSGRIWTFLPNANGTPNGPVVERTAQFAIPGSELIPSFGEDANGELYVCDSSGGEIWRLEEQCVAQVNNFCTSTQNSNGSGAVIFATGSGSIAANDTELLVAGAAVNQPGIFYYGGAEVQIPFGDGIRCVGAGSTGVFRLNPAVISDPFGDAQRAWNLAAPPSNAGAGMVNAGDTWKVQYWFRDPQGGGSGFNFSNGLSITFCP